MNTDRKLVTIRQIDRVIPIYRKRENELARCELVTFGGWKAMVSRSDGFKPGDLAVFAETDSVFPKDDERFAFLQKCNYRIKTQKYSAMVDENGETVISQGLCLPLSFLPEGTKAVVGMDVTDLLGVVHAPESDEYEFEDNAEFTSNTPKLTTFGSIIPQKLHDKLRKHSWYRKIAFAKKVYAGFPKEVSKTDEERIQNLPNITKVPTTWTLTEKVDGTSSTYLLKKVRTPLITRIFKGQQYDFAVCSRNNRLDISSGGIQWAMAKKYDIECVLKYMLKNSEMLFGKKYDWICIQGECIGPKIQKNRLKLDHNELRVFNLITPDRRIKSLEAADLLKEFNILWVPIIDCRVIINGKTCDDLLKLADSEPSLINKECLREGIVFRAEDPTMNLSFKAVSPKYLLKNNE